MDLNEKELMSKLENYFNTKSKEEIINDLISSGGAKMLNLNEGETKYVAVYCSKEKYSDCVTIVSDYVHKDYDKAESEIISKSYKYCNSNSLYEYNTGDNSFEMWAYIKELIEF